LKCQKLNYQKKSFSSTEKIQIPTLPQIQGGDLSLQRAYLSASRIGQSRSRQKGASHFLRRRIFRPERPEERRPRLSGAMPSVRYPQAPALCRSARDGMNRFVVPLQGTEIYFGPQPRAPLRFALGSILAAFPAARILRCARFRIQSESKSGFFRNKCASVRSVRQRFLHLNT
jgi:hypothetical protein